MKAELLAVNNTTGEEKRMSSIIIMSNGCVDIPPISEGWSWKIQYKPEVEKK